MIRRWCIVFMLSVLPRHSALADLDAGLAAVRGKDYAAARVEFEILAEKGDADAQVNLGNLYMKGWGTPQDYATAYDWYRKAAEQNHRIAQGKLGVLHYYGLGTVKDAAAAAKWFELAADQGDPSAQSALGTLYAQGDGVSRNLVKAYFWLTLAFEFGDTQVSALRLQLAEEMTPGEMMESLAKVEEWKRDKAIPDPGGAPLEQAPEAAPGEPVRESPPPKRSAKRRPGR